MIWWGRKLTEALPLWIRSESERVVNGPGCECVVWYSLAANVFFSHTYDYICIYTIWQYTYHVNDISLIGSLGYHHIIFHAVLVDSLGFIHLAISRRSQVKSIGNEAAAHACEDPGTLSRSLGNMGNMGNCNLKAGWCMVGWCMVGWCGLRLSIFSSPNLRKMNLHRD